MAARRDLAGPLAARGRALNDGQACGAGTRERELAELLEEVADEPHAGSLCRTDERDGVAEFVGERERVDLAAAILEQVRHIKEHERGQAERQNRRGKHELPVEVHAVQHQQHGVGRGYARHVALQHVDGDARVFGVGCERVDAGQVDEREVRAAEALHRAGVVFDGDAGIVGDLLSHPGQTVEERGLAAVGRADERDGADAAGALPAVLRTVRGRLRGSYRWLGDRDGGCRSAAVHFLVPARGSFQLYGDVPRGFLAKSNLNAVYPVDRRIAGRGAAEDLDVGAGKEIRGGRDGR